MIPSQGLFKPAATLPGVLAADTRCAAVEIRGARGCKGGPLRVARYGGENISDSRLLGFPLSYPSSHLWSLPNTCLQSVLCVVCHDSLRNTRFHCLVFVINQLLLNIAPIQ